MFHVLPLKSRPNLPEASFRRSELKPRENGDTILRITHAASYPKTSEYYFAFRGSLVIGFTPRSALTIEIPCLWKRRSYLPLR
jgi:hypothetical protein